MYDIQIQVLGGAGTGKTSLLAVLADFLSSKGADVTVQRADPQIDDKLANQEKSLERVLQSKILITELQTGRATTITGK